MGRSRTDCNNNLLRLSNPDYSSIGSFGHTLYQNIRNGVYMDYFSSMLIRAHTQVQTNYQQEAGLFRLQRGKLCDSPSSKTDKAVRKIVKMLHIVNYERSSH